VSFLDLAIAGAAFRSPLAVSALRTLTGRYTVPLVVLVVDTVVGSALFSRRDRSERVGGYLNIRSR